MSFDTLGLAPEFVRVVADEGYTEPTPVQTQAIPLVQQALTIFEVIEDPNTEMVRKTLAQWHGGHGTI